jgi:hypothetical protein
VRFLHLRAVNGGFMGFNGNKWWFNGNKWGEEQFLVSWASRLFANWKITIFTT